MSLIWLTNKFLEMETLDVYTYNQYTSNFTDFDECLKQRRK